MLKQLNVKNIAIIENIEVAFDKGMNVLTGEPGAGKSLLIDAIGLLLGDRADTDVVRSGESEAEVSGIFAPLNEAVKEYLDTLEVPHEDELIIRRRISIKRGSTVKVNDVPLTVQSLRRLTDRLADIHTQHDTKRLINPETYLSLLDHYDEAIADALADYRNRRAQYLKALHAYRELARKRQETMENLDFLRHQAEDIDSHNLEAGEEETIEQRLKTLRNFDTIFHAVKGAYEAAFEHEAPEQVFEAARSLEEAERHDENFSSFRERLESAYFELDDIRTALYEQLNALDFDPDELERLETRKHTLETLKRKYGMSIEALIARRSEIEEELAAASDYDERLEEAKTQATHAFEEAYEAAQALSDLRRRTAERIEDAMEQELSDLELKEASFTIALERREPEHFEDSHALGESGLDRVDFRLTTNRGETPKPLKHVASGGELSRIMLALKTLLIRQEALNLMVFDEIDTGVSGYVASQVAKKMKGISEDMQVLAITHLPQVAALADTHYRIHKRAFEGRTQARLETLDEEGRVHELAAMISSEEITESALKSARELLK